MKNFKIFSLGKSLGKILRDKKYFFDTKNFFQNYFITNFFIR